MPKPDIESRINPLEKPPTPQQEAGEILELPREEQAALPAPDNVVDLAEWKKIHPKPATEVRQGSDDQPAEIIDFRKYKSALDWVQDVIGNDKLVAKNASDMVEGIDPASKRYQEEKEKREKAA